MTTNTKPKWKLTLITMTLVVGLISVVEAGAMGTGFTYQGRLMDKNRPANGVYDLQFKLYDSEDPAAGTQLGATIDKTGVDVIDGHFVLELNFGSQFDGKAVWLETTVLASPLGSEAATLSPLLELTPAPYALYAEVAGADNDWRVSGDDMFAIPGGACSYDGDVVHGSWLLCARGASMWLARESRNGFFMLDNVFMVVSVEIASLLHSSQ